MDHDAVNYDAEIHFSFVHIVVRIMQTVESNRAHEFPVNFNRPFVYFVVRPAVLLGYVESKISCFESIHEITSVFLDYEQGHNWYGQLGLESNTAHWDPPNEPVMLSVDFTPISIHGGSSFTCSLSDDGRVACFGKNDNGELGVGNTEATGNQPGDMDNLEEVDLGTHFTASQIVLGTSHVCALSTENAVKCWGSNSGKIVIHLL